MKTLLELIASIRHGIPEKCHFCDQPFTDSRQPIPEEAGAWACTECVQRWRREDAAAQESDDIPQILGGWAPGHYHQLACARCGKPFEGDKRAFRCEPCSMIVIRKEKP